jgi:hypothetical protein
MAHTGHCVNLYRRRIPMTALLTQPPIPPMNRLLLWQEWRRAIDTDGQPGSEYIHWLREFRTTPPRVTDYENYRRRQELNAWERSGWGKEMA